MGTVTALKAQKKNEVRITAQKCAFLTVCQELALIVTVYKQHLEQGEKGSGKERGDFVLAALLESPVRGIEKFYTVKATAI